MFKWGCGLEFLLVLCGLEFSWSCPRHCTCYTGPSTVSCQSHNFLTVPEGFPPDSERIFLQNNKIHRLLRGHFSTNTDNHLKFLPDDIFMDLHNLSHLFLHGNHLWSLNQNTFRGLRALDRLLLHQNQIEWVDRLAFHDLKRLSTLYLFNNSLVQLSGQCLDMLPGLEYLRLNDNPWSCDCKAVSLWEWLKRFRGSTSTVGCQAPSNMVGKDLKELRKEDFPNCSPTVSNSESRAQTNNLSGTVNPSMNRGVVVGPGNNAHSSRPGRTRNCTKPRIRVSKGKGDNEVHHSKEVMTDKDDSSEGGKHDHTLPDGTVTQRKQKCPRTTVRPPSGVLQANNRATLSQSILHVYVLLVALVTTSTGFIR